MPQVAEPLSARITSINLTVKQAKAIENNIIFAINIKLCVFPSHYERVRMQIYPHIYDFTFYQSFYHGIMQKILCKSAQAWRTR